METVKRVGEEDNFCRKFLESSLINNMIKEMIFFVILNELVGIGVENLWLFI